MGGVHVHHYVDSHPATAMELAGWLPAAVTRCEGVGRAEGGDATPPLPMNAWDTLPFAVEDVAAAEAPLPAPRFRVRALRSAAALAPALPPHAALFLQRYVVEGAATTPLGLRLVHPAAVFTFAQ